jgi:hypothetical protein
MTEKTTEKKKSKTASPYKNLTVSQKAEAIALWRSGKVTLADLSKKFGKRPEAFSRMFARLEIAKGAAIPEMAKKLEAKVEEHIVSDLDKTMRRIAKTKDDHFNMSNGIAKIAWSEIIRARQAGTDIAALKDMMTTLKLASEVVGTARKELFAILNVDKYDQEADFENLPELTVRELSNSELSLLQAQSVDDMGLDSDPGADMLSDTFDEGV